MRRKRLTWFLIMIGLGLVAGLAYGWLINPVQYVDTAPNSLHPDYKADYVLMVAEIYRMDSDLPGALQRLSLLGLTPQRVVADGLLVATKAGYADQDLTALQLLAQAVQAVVPTGAVPTGAAPAPTSTGSGGQP